MISFVAPAQHLQYESILVDSSLTILSSFMVQLELELISQVRKLEADQFTRNSCQTDDLLF